jgi:hypothetical protein
VNDGHRIIPDAFILGGKGEYSVTIITPQCDLSENRSIGSYGVGTDRYEAASLSGSQSSPFNGITCGIRKPILRMSTVEEHQQQD